MRPSLRGLGLAAAGLASLGGLAALWAVGIEPRLLDVREEVGWVPGLPPGWAGQRLALFGDIQVGIALANVDTIRRAVARVLEERPAAALIAGDFVFEAAEAPDGPAWLAADLVSPLPARGIPTYAVLGNHDYADAPSGNADRRGQVARAVRGALDAVGVRVLRNEAVPLPAPGGGDTGGTGGEQPLYLVGIAPHLPGRDRPLDALGRVPPGAPRIVLMHNPDSFPPLPTRSAPLALAGHTHGGQIRVPGLPRLTPARLFKPWPQYVDGWIEGFGQPGNHLYVNRGIGFSRLPLRFGCRPELTLFTLRAGSADESA